MRMHMCVSVFMCVRSCVWCVCARLRRACGRTCEVCMCLYVRERTRACVIAHAYVLDGRARVRTGVRARIMHV